MDSVTLFFYIGCRVYMDFLGTLPENLLDEKRRSLRVVNCSPYAAFRTGDRHALCMEVVSPMHRPGLICSELLVSRTGPQFFSVV